MAELREPDSTRRRYGRPNLGCLRLLRATSLLGCLMLSVASPVVYGQNAPSGLPGESKAYFTQQPADTPMVIRMDAFETEFETRVFDPKDIQLKASGLTGRRLGAVYQFIEASNKARQLRIEVKLGHGTARSKLDMQVIRFEPSGPDRSALMRAYRLLSAGLELPVTGQTDEWTLKVVTLMQAARFFDEMGMQEMYLWSAFYAHHFLLEFLHDPVTAAEGGREIFVAATRSRLNDLALAALQMEGSAAAAQAAGKEKDVAKALFEQAQGLFTQAAELATQMDFQHERAQAVYHSGLAFEAEGDTGRAFAQFDEAVEIANTCGDIALANQIRQHAAELHESLGDNAEAIALMQQISAGNPPENAVPDVESEESPAPEESGRAGEDMVNYLLEQGRLLEKTYRHAEAAEVLRQALELNQKSASPLLSGPVALLVAKSLYGAGQFDDALNYLQQGIKKTPSFRHEKTLYEAYGILAAIQRAKGDFAAMSTARKRQKLFLTQPDQNAAFAFASALDLAAASGPASNAALASFRKARDESGNGGANTLQQLAVLHLCAAGESCSAAIAREAVTRVQAAGLPVPALQARLLLSQVLRREGQWTSAANELDGLIEDMRFFQSRLPGVLGAWYWQNREHVFSSFMALILEQPGARNGHEGDNALAVRSLDSLDRIMRYTREEATGAAASTGDGNAERLRSLIAAREAGESSRETPPLSELISQEARTWQAGQAQSRRPVSRALHGLADDAALLTYYITAERAYAWIGRNDDLNLVQVPWSAGQSAMLSQAAEALRWDAANGRTSGFAVTMDQLGQSLLAPVLNFLPRVIYFFPSGPLEGFPLDALRRDGEYLAERHQVINLMSLNIPGADQIRIGPEALRQVFLAGNRQEGAGDFERLKPPSKELGDIAEMFVGPGLHIVQGAALQWDEFQDERFARAGILHLAMPGNINLRNPEQSQLLLSDNADDPAHTALLPQDIEASRLNAALAVLSACDFTGTNPSAFEQNTRFINEFLHAGVGSVVASLWRVGDLQAAQFMRHFYQQLVNSQNAEMALSETKQIYLARNEKSDNEAWAAFQLFTR